jgi:ParB-like chromosome segregation protein Spo0J
MHKALPHHPLADIFPLLEGVAFESFVNDIREQGLRDPATVLDGMLLDGRNRQRACLLVDVPLRTVDYTGDDPLAYIISTNLERRHLNPSQLAMVGARISTMKVGNPTFGNSANLPNKVSQPDAAARVNVSERSIRHAAVVLDKAEPEVVVAVDQGKIAVSVAASIASKPRDAQLGRLAREERKAEDLGTRLRRRRDFQRADRGRSRGDQHGSDRSRLWPGRHRFPDREQAPRQMRDHQPAVQTR